MPHRATFPFGDRIRDLQGDFPTVLMIAGIAALASVVGGLIALWRAPTTLFMSSALGFASGVLLGTIALEMIPEALGGGMFYLIITDLVPEAQLRHSQQSPALATGLGFLLVLVLTEFL